MNLHRRALIQRVLLAIGTITKDGIFKEEFCLFFRGVVVRHHGVYLSKPKARDIT